MYTMQAVHQGSYTRRLREQDIFEDMQHPSAKSSEPPEALIGHC